MTNYTRNPSIFDEIAGSREACSDKNCLWCQKTLVQLRNPTIHYRQVVVMYDFDAEQEYELQLSAGDIVKKVSQIDENWYFGSFKGKSGYFPVSFATID